MTIVPDPRIPLVLLLDHDNIPFGQVSIKDLVGGWLDHLGDRLSGGGILSIRVRAYGGWYATNTTSEGRFRASEFYQENCPSGVIYGKHFCRLSFEFADHLVESTALKNARGPVRITHTVTARGSARHVTMRPGVSPCTESDCQVRAVRTWIRSKHACFRQGCPRQFAEFFQRLEQKQVDVHLAVDMLSYAEKVGSGVHLAVASDDADLLPALAAAALRGRKNGSLTVLRFVAPSAYLDGFLAEQGVGIVRIPVLI